MTKFLFYLCALLDLIAGVSIILTGNSAPLFSQVANDFLLAFFFIMFGLAESARNDEDNE